VERAGDDRQRSRREHRRTQSLPGTRGEQGAGVAGERGHQRRDGEHAEAGEEHAPAAEEIGGATAEQQQAAEDQRVARDRPAEVRTIDGQIGRQVGERDVHGGDVEDDHELRDRQQQKQRPANRAGGGCVGCVATTVHGAVSTYLRQ
jgi:hypothetical protein